jgi:hypothetical protein
MSLVRGRVLPVLLAATVVVGGADLAAYAAHGTPLLLGASNKARGTTTIKYGDGTPLKLRGDKKKPPLAVGSDVKVGRLNADRVDDLEGAALQNSVWTYSLPPITEANKVTGFQRGFPGLPAGRYLASYSVSAGVSAANLTIACDLAPTSGAAGLAASTSPVFDAGGFLFAAVSASGYVDTTTSAHRLVCAADKGGKLWTDDPSSAIRSEVTFLRVDAVVAGTAG